MTTPTRQGGERRHRTRRALAAVAASATLAGGTAVGLAGAAGASTSNPPVARQVILTVGSSGSTTLVTEGEIVVVKLSSPHLRWSEAAVVSASPQSVLRKISGHQSPNGASLTRFEVVGHGAATLQATGAPICTGSVCTPLLVLWQANVFSPVVDPPGPAT